MEKDARQKLSVVWYVFYMGIALSQTVSHCLSPITFSTTVFFGGVGVLLSVKPPYCKSTQPLLPTCTTCNMIRNQPSSCSSPPSPPELDKVTFFSHQIFEAGNIYFLERLSGAFLIFLHTLWVVSVTLSPHLGCFASAAVK